MVLKGVIGSGPTTATVGFCGRTLAAERNFLKENPAGMRWNLLAACYAPLGHNPKDSELRGGPFDSGYWHQALILNEEAESWSKAFRRSSGRCPILVLLQARGRRG